MGSLNAEIVSLDKFESVNQSLLVGRVLWYFLIKNVRNDETLLEIPYWKGINMKTRVAWIAVYLEVVCLCALEYLLCGDVCVCVWEGRKTGGEMLGCEIIYMWHNVHMCKA